MKENVLIRGPRGRRGRWGEDPGNFKPIDPSRLPEGYPYKEAIEDVILTERTIEIAWSDASSIYRCDLEVENRIALVPEQEYCAVWNGKEYRAVCGADSLGIAQLTITTEDGTVTFQNWASGYYVKCSYDCGGTATVAIKHCYEVTHRIEPTLLPEGYPYKETVEKAVLDNVALESADGYEMAYGITAYGDLSESDSVTVAAVEDMLSFENITVIFDGTEYHYTVADATPYKAYVDGSMIEIGIYVGNRWLGGKSEAASDEQMTNAGVTDTGEPFCLMLPYLSGKEGTVYAEDGENHTITVKLWNEVTHTMAEEFLPESVKGGGGASADLMLYCSNTSEVTAGTLSVKSGDVATVLSKIGNGEPVNILIVGGSSEAKWVYPCIGVWHNGYNSVDYELEEKEYTTLYLGFYGYSLASGEMGLKNITMRYYTDGSVIFS